MFAFIFILCFVITGGLLIISPKKNAKNVLILSAILFGILGYMMLPRAGVYVDTVRFFDTLDTARNQLLTGNGNSWNYLFDYSGYSATPVIGLILYLVALQPENGFLTLVAAICDVGAGYYLICRQSGGRYSRKSVVITTLVFLSILNFNAGVSGVRSYAASALAACIAFRFSKKINLSSMLLYIPLILIHPIVVIVPFVYLLSFFFGKHKVFFALSCLLLMLQSRLQGFIFTFINRFSNIPFFASISFKSQQYFGDDAYIVLPTENSRWRTILILAFIIITLLLYNLAKIKPDTKIIGMVILFISFAIGSFNDEILFSRSEIILLYLILPIIYDIFFDSLSDGIIISSARAFILLSAVLFLIDNLRAGVKFQIISLDWISLLLMSVAFIWFFFTCQYSTQDIHDFHLQM